MLNVEPKSCIRKCIIADDQDETADQRSRSASNNQRSRGISSVGAAGL